MKTAIFIRTYRGDAQWLNYCLKSIKKFASGFHELVVVSPESDIDIIPNVVYANGFNHAPTCRNYGADYLGQQITKMEADLYCKANTDAILFVDSDMCFKTPFTPETFLVNDKLRIQRETYQNLGFNDQVRVWKNILEECSQVPNLQYEYMRQMPIAHYPATLKKSREWLEELHKQKYDDFITGRGAKGFSEFNFIGLTAETFFKDQYHWHTVDTDGVVPVVALQFWSHGGILPEIKLEIEELIK